MSWRSHDDVIFKLHPETALQALPRASFLLTTAHANIGTYPQTARVHVTLLDDSRMPQPP